MKIVITGLPQAGQQELFSIISGQDIVNATVQGDTIVHIKIIRKGKAAKKFKADKKFAELNV